MLSIQAMAGGQGEYYLGLAREDYYLEGGEPTGLWWGRGADSLKLRGVVQRDALRKMLCGFSVHGEKLTQNAGREHRRPGWDLTFSAPKSVSVLWSQANTETRTAIQEAHVEAVKAALDYLESEAGFSRRGKAGQEVDRAELCFALFEHGTSRAGDPQLHTHCLVMNVGVRPDGTTGTVVSREFYQHKMTAGAIYRAQLACLLRNQLGLESKRCRTWFELVGVPSSLCDFFSKRRQQIEAKLGELGLETASAAAFATLATRSVKSLVPPRKELFNKWRADARDQGVSYEGSKTQRAPSKLTDHHKAYRQALAEAVAVVTQKQSHFSEKDLLRRTMEAAQDKYLDAKFVRSMFKKDLEDRNRFVRMSQRDGYIQYTTKEVLTQEGRLFELADRLKNRGWGVPRIVSPLCGWKLSPDQKRAMLQVTAEKGRISILSGMAGSGKTKTLDACRKRWERAGYRVIGTALSGKAAKELQSGSKIKSCTLHALWLRMNPTLDFRMRHHARQFWRALLNKPTSRLKPLKIDRNTVLVVDEAGMIGTGQMTRLLETVNRQGGKIVFVGDAGQLQPIEAGSPFAALAKRLGCAELTEIVRQKDEKDRQVVKDMAAGRAEAAIKSLAERRRLEVHPTRERAMSELVSTWSRLDGKDAAKSLIFCSTNKEAHALNISCQAQQALRHRLDTQRSVQIHEARAHVGDRVLFTQNAKKLGISNGETGTVIRIDRLSPRITVRVDGGHVVRVSPGKYTRRDGEHRGECALRLGYAVTTHKGQGTTVDNAYVLAGGSMQDREISYVQVSRARRETRVFVDQRTAGDKLSGLTMVMERSRAKEMAHDMLEELHEEIRSQTHKQRQRISV